MRYRRLDPGLLIRNVALVSVLASCVGPDPADLVVAGVTVIDGTGAAPYGPVSVVVRDGRIDAILDGPAPEVESDETIKVNGGFLVPGFVDLHVHLPRDSAVQDSILSQLVRFGVTTILNPGAREGAGVRLRDRLVGSAPRMLTAGRIIESRGPSPGVSEWASLVSTEDEVREEVARQAAAGVDFIKYYSGVPPDLAAAIADEAQRFGLPVIAHAGATNWSESAAAGVSMLVHSGWGTPMDELVDLPDPEAATDSVWYASYAAAPRSPGFRDLTRTLVAHDVTVVPTVAITQASGLGRDATLLPLFETDLAPEADLVGWWPDGWRQQHPQYGDVSEEEARLLEEIYWPGVLGIVAAMNDAGVRLGIGTDVGNAWITPGASFHYEMELYGRAGILPIQILSMATRNGAVALGLDSLGTVEVGNVADLVVLGSNPLDDIRATRSIELVLVGGEVAFRR